MKKYVVAWKSDSGKTGKSSQVFDTREEAEELKKWADKQHKGKGFIHWVEEVKE